MWPDLSCIWKALFRFDSVIFPLEETVNTRFYQIERVIHNYQLNWKFGHFSCFMNTDTANLSNEFMSFIAMHAAFWKITQRSAK